MINVVEAAPIEYLGPREAYPHSSVFSDGKRVRKIRDPLDTVGSYYLRCEIDRSGDLMLREMKDEQGRFIRTLTLETLREQGQIAILDAGCGTGRTLNEIRTHLLFRTKARPEDILTVGVNDIDFSDESELVATRKAIRDGVIQYVIDDLEKVDLPQDKFDLITSFEVLNHNKPEKVVGIIKNLLRFLSQDGLLIFDLETYQREKPEIVAFIDSLLENGHSFSEYTLYSPLDRAERIFIRIRKISSEE